jgi:regulator of protease activity HflC (stomatin/prohibitin superfamily)
MRTVTIREYERGLLYRKGHFVRLLEPGRYRLWPWQYAEVTLVDMRESGLDITDQVILTADKINLRLSLYAVYSLSDPVRAIHQVARYQARLYREVQLAARAVISQHTLDALLQERNLLGQSIHQEAAPRVEPFGLALQGVAVRDVILPADVRGHMAELVAARQRGQTALQVARDEVAATRALLNAARLVREHPELMRLKELQALTHIAEQPGHLVITPLSSPTSIAVVANQE